MNFETGYYYFLQKPLSNEEIILSILPFILFVEFVVLSFSLKTVMIGFPFHVGFPIKQNPLHTIDFTTNVIINHQSTFCDGLALSIHVLDELENSIFLEKIVCSCFDQISQVMDRIKGEQKELTRFDIFFKTIIFLSYKQRIKSHYHLCSFVLNLSILCLLCLMFLRIQLCFAKGQ